MRVFLRRLAFLVVAIATKLEAHPKTGREPEHYNPSYPEPGQLKLAIHYLGESTRHFLSGGIFLRLAVKHCANSMLNSAKHLMLRGWRLCGVFRQSKVQISHSCKRSDSKKDEVSND